MIVPQRRWQQPGATAKINPALAIGLRYLLHPPICRGALRNLVNQSEISAALGSGVVDGGYGNTHALTFSGAQDVGAATHGDVTWFDGWTQQTILATGVYSSAATEAGTIVSKWGADGSNQAFLLAISTANTLFYAAYDGTGAIGLWESTATIARDIPFTVAFSFVGGTAAHSCVNGVSEVLTSSISGVDFIGNANSQFAVGACEGNDNRLTGKLGLVAIWSHAKTVAELRNLCANCWQVFERPRRVLYSLPAASGSQALTPSIFTNSQTFYSPTVDSGAVTLSPALFTDTDTFYVPTVSASAVTLAPILFTNGNTLPSPTVTPGEVALQPPLLNDGDAFFAPAVSTSYALTPGLFSNAGIFFAPAVTPGAVTLLPGLFGDADTFFAPIVDLAGTQTLAPSRLDNAATFFAATVTPGAVAALPSLLTNTATFFAPTVAPGAVTVAPQRLDNAPTFFSATVSQGAGSVQILPSLYTNAHQFFQSTLQPGEVAIYAPLLLANATFFPALVFSGTAYVQTKRVFVATATPRAFVSTQGQRVFASGE